MIPGRDMGALEDLILIQRAVQIYQPRNLQRDTVGSQATEIEGLGNILHLVCLPL